MSRKGCEAALHFNFTADIVGPALRAFRDTRPLLQGAVVLRTFAVSQAVDKVFANACSPLNSRRTASCTIIDQAKPWIFMAFLRVQALKLPTIAVSRPVDKLFG